ncbi:MAG: ribonuclease activity regulator RraA [Paracoccaceae bacterium]
MIKTEDIRRPPQAQVDALKAVGTATISSTLARMGIRNAHMDGPVTHNSGKVAAGPALTLQFMPQRGDLFEDGEYVDPEDQLHRHVLYHVQAGDFVVVDARADMTSGVFGDMMLTYFKGCGGSGLVIDGCIRDYPNVKVLDLPIWVRGVTPNYHIQTNIMPFAVNVPVAMAEEVIVKASAHHDWEEFSKERLLEGGDLRRYYPLHDDARGEYEEWRKKNPAR